MEAKKRIKITTEIMKLADKEVGFEVEGIFTGQSERPWNDIDKESGEVVEKAITQYHFEKPENKERFLVFADAGLQSAVASAAVQKGDHIVIQKLAKVELKGGRRVNQYDIFQITN